MAKPTYYEILQIEPTATADQIKVAYRRLAMFHHPDKVKHLGEAAQKQAEGTMMAISEALEVLRNPEKRKLYDRCLKEHLDYTIEYSRAQSETPEDVKARQQKEEAKRYMFPAVLRIAKDNVQQLVEDSKWQCQDDERAFSSIMKGLGGGDRMWVRVRVFDEFAPADLAAVVKELDALVPEGPSSNLIRDHFGWLVLSQRFKDDIAVREAVKKYNFGMTQAKRGEPRRGVALVKIDKRAQPFFPHGENLRPPLAKLELKLV